nr:septum formation family protein [Zhihengliuella flava]
MVAVVVAATFFVIRSVTADDAGPATNVERNEDPGIDGIIATQAPASMFEVGDCLSDFTSPLEPATIVECSTRHDAQFIGTAALEQDIPYPGKPGTTDKAVEACKAIELNTDVLTAFEWEYHFSQPTADSWEAGDRTVACFLATTNDGDMATGTLLRSDAAASASS